MNGPRGKSLRPVLELAADGESFNALASALGEAGSPVDAHVSSSLRPFVLAALLEQPEVLRRGPALIVATDDRSARDLAADISAYLSPRPVRLYPSRGTGYLSHIAPPPHLAGLRVAALDALASPTGELRGPAGRGRRARSRSPRRCPTPSFAPRGSP